MIAAVAGVTSIGLRPEGHRAHAPRGLIALPEDLGIRRNDATRELLAAKSIAELVEWSGGLYRLPNSGLVMSALIARQAPSAAERLADLAVQALVDEADLSQPGLVDRRGSGVHSDLHLGLMHASAQSLWPAFAAMADAARCEARVSQALRETLGQLGRDGEAEMLRVTAGVNTHRGAIWALGLLSAAAMLESGASAGEIAASAAALARLDDPAAPHNPDSHGARVCRRYGVLGAREQRSTAFRGHRTRLAATPGQSPRRRRRAERQARCTAGDHEQPDRHLRAASRRS